MVVGLLPSSASALLHRRSSSSSGFFGVSPSSSPSSSSSCNDLQVPNWSWRLQAAEHGMEDQTRSGYAGDKRKLKNRHKGIKSVVMAGEDEKMEKIIGTYGGKVRIVSSTDDDDSMEQEEEGAAAASAAAEEMMLLWGIQQPTLSKPNAFVSQSSLCLPLDACGRSLSILQSPSSVVFFFSFFLPLLQSSYLMLQIVILVLCSLGSAGTPGVTGAVLWDSGVVLGKFLEHAVESGMMLLRGKKVVELGSGCGLVGCIAALLGAKVTLTDLPDRLRLLRKNIETNLYGDVRGSAAVSELIWGEEPDTELIDPSPDFDAILEYFLESVSKDFTVGRVDQTQWHPEYCSPRVVVYVLVKK
ncbi:hypothetical protein RHMOL_Rhmol08G0151000 [Rhododendron molle]|uniref:Uncharacterized protein n=2 Tax=Rhododendron molle TaxID=49168 RepID=A0ACC0MPR9_RHOML|nr:hypothetical protein RHMOL_Rhmol08G0151000 [Rhododendron molle]KAI8542614.1 hypothetical protein RHMOL_Rhmol08G0151000 [Rhododendron molle]